MDSQRTHSLGEKKFIQKFETVHPESIGADLPGAVGANVPIGKGSMGTCTQRKNWCIYYLSGVSSCVGYRCEVQTFANEY